jgi:hypothetical protein
MLTHFYINYKAADSLYIYDNKNNCRQIKKIYYNRYTNKITLDKKYFQIMIISDINNSNIVRNQMHLVSSASYTEKLGHRSDLYIGKCPTRISFNSQPEGIA